MLLQPYGFEASGKEVLPLEVYGYDYLNHQDSQVGLGLGGRTARGSTTVIVGQRVPPPRCRPSVEADRAGRWRPPTRLSL